MADTKQPVIYAIKKLNSRNKAFPIATYDFSTFYTMILHDERINAMRELINFFFRGGEDHFIDKTKFGLIWTDIEKKFNITFDKASLKLAINFLFDNFFLTLVL